MEQSKFILNANPIVRALQKPADELTKADIIGYIVENQIEMVNFMYPDADMCRTANPLENEELRMKNEELPC